MKSKKRKKKYLKYVILALLFLVIVGVSLSVAILKKNASEEEFSQMQPATLPVVFLTYEGGFETELHGYVSDMDLKSMRGCIVPLDENKRLSVSVNTYGRQLTSLKYHLRSLNDEAYIDGGTVADLETQGSIYSASVRFSDLIESGTEYQLVLEVIADEQTAFYYTRVLYSRTDHAGELLQFAEEFSESTYDRERAEKFIVNYLQPDESVSADDYSYTNIHSKYANFTYGALNVERGEKVHYRITEMEATQVSVTLEYPIRMQIGEEWKTYDVEEYFCVRYRSEKVYLLDYFRNIEQTFRAEKATRERGRISIGISAGDTQIMNSENNTYTVFVQGRELWSYNARTNAMNLIFSFMDEDDPSDRSSYGHHDVQVVKISNEGDIDYMVYGYMNRGSYEGQVGICFYRYSAENNSTRRLFYMPVYQSEQVLMMDLGTLGYVNDQDVCYLRYGDVIYSIDLSSGESVEVSIRAYPGMYAMNEQRNVVAWQEGSDLTYPERLVILNMDTQTTAVVNAPEGEYVKILDFIGDDIIYGFGAKEDSITIANVDMQQLLKKVIIASTDEELKIQQEYEANGFFIMDAEVLDTRVTISRGQKEKDGTFRTIEDDVLLLTQDIIDNSEKSMLMNRVNDPEKKVYYIQIGNTTNTDSQFSTVVPRFEMLKDVNVIKLQHQQSNVYYVYGYGRLLAVESEINKAIDEAYEVFGVVVDENMNYLWTRGTRDLIKTISIQPYKAENDSDALAAALRVLCAQVGLQLPHVSQDLAAGLSPLDIIDQALGEGSAVSLYGCTLQEVLYFINQGRPVLSVIDDRTAVILYGYDTESVSVYFPASGENLTLGMQDAEAYFKGYSNSFISYKE